MLITGTSRGIGKAIAEHYLEQGWFVVGCSRGEATITHNSYYHESCDVTDEVSVKKIFSYIQKERGSLEALVNNAGRASLNHAMLTPVSKLRDLLETNTVGTFLFSREAAKVMSRKKYGRIVNFSTVAVPLHLEGEAAYVASKAAVVALTQVLAREVGQMGITVNAVGPTPIDTDLIRKVPKEKIDKLLKSQAIQRLGEFDDVLNVIDFFVSPRSNFITGQVVYLGGV